MQLASQKTRDNILKNNVFYLGDDAAYQFWRHTRLKEYPVLRDESIVTVKNPDEPTRHEISQIVNLCRNSNMAIYDSGGSILPQTLKRFCSHFGLHTSEGHRSAGDSGVVSIQTETRDGRSGYIPYTNKPLSWHTDGYYNAPQDTIRAMVLHCQRDASEGGVNELLDPEIAYIRLRDENPDFIAALMHPQAMMIPANEDPRSAYRPDSMGPVFSVDEKTGHLHMRFSARTRNIVWREDKTTRQAREFLLEVLQHDPMIVRHKLQSGQGIISNNVLHNRTGFVDADDARAARLLYRIRYKERVASEPLSS